MIPAHTTASRCGSCGADLPLVGAPCPACPVVEVAGEEEAQVLAETVEAVACEATEAECVKTPLWMRLSVASVYLLVSVACVYSSLGFFDADRATSSDWVFGAMAIGLALIALLGVKEALFPTDWTPE